MVDRFIMCCIHEIWQRSVIYVYYDLNGLLCAGKRIPCILMFFDDEARQQVESFDFRPLSSGASPKPLGIREFADTTPLIYFKGWKYHSGLLFFALIRHIGTFIARKHHKFLDFHVPSIRFDDLSLASASNTSITICFGAFALERTNSMIIFSYPPS